MLEGVESKCKISTQCKKEVVTKRSNKKTIEISLETLSNFLEVFHLTMERNSRPFSVHSPICIFSEVAKRRKEKKAHTLSDCIKRNFM